MFIRLSAVMLLFVAVLLMMSPSGFGQQKGNKGNKGGGTKDPKEFFQKLANGKDYIVVAEVAFPNLRDPLAAFAKEQGITDGKITLEKYMQFSEQRTAARLANGGGKGGPGGGKAGPGGGGFKKPDGDPSVKFDLTKKGLEKPAEKPVDRSLTELTKMAEEQFKRMDRNGDGMLNDEEIRMDPILNRELIHWDKSPQDGLIDVKEYVPYFIEHFLKDKEDREKAAQAEQPPAGSSGRTIIEEDLETRPVVYRYGKLPKELPDWFEKYDTNQDGLVSLGEWRKADRSFEDFKAIDRNDDGLLTPEEVLRFMGQQNLTAGNTTQTAGGKSFGRPGAGPGTGNPNVAASNGQPNIAIDWLQKMSNRGGRQGGNNTGDVNGGGKGGKGGYSGKKGGKKGDRGGDSQDK